MGALRKCMPVTAATFIVGWLAIAGVPPFAGFWSKDEILLVRARQEPGAVRRRPRHRPAHRLLHDPPGDHGLLRRGAAGRTTSGRARRARRLQAPREPVDHARPARRARRAVRRRRRHPPARLWLPDSITGGSSTGSSRSSSSARRNITGTCGRHRARAARGHRHVGAPARHRRRLARVPDGDGSRRSSRRSSPTAGTTTRPSPPSWAARAARRSRATAWFDANVVDGAVNGTADGRAHRRRWLRKAQSGYVRTLRRRSSASASCCVLAWFVLVRGTPVRARGARSVAFPILTAIVLLPAVGALVVVARRQAPARAGQARSPCSSPASPPAR